MFQDNERNGFQRKLPSLPFCVTPAVPPPKQSVIKAEDAVLRLRRDLLSEAHGDDARVVARDVERDLLDRLDLGHGIVRMVLDAHADKELKGSELIDTVLLIQHLMPACTPALATSVCRDRFLRQAPSPPAASCSNARNGRGS